MIIRRTMELRVNGGRGGILNEIADSFRMSLHWDDDIDIAHRKTGLLKHLLSWCVSILKTNATSYKHHELSMVTGCPSDCYCYKSILII